ncbi:MAG: oligosaccharide flippase family protein [Crocosphaera sp.]|nr:oligosaccharide flippase family protein [Crocosphaera sp.]
MSSIKKKAITGTIWTVVGYGGSQVLRLGGNIILTRLLVPELFGLMALINTFITGLNLFSDIGIRPSIIRSPRGDDPVFLNTAWTLQVIRGFVLWLGSCLIAWPVSQFYDNPQLLWLLPIVGLVTIFNGFTSTSLATLNREIKLDKLTKFNFGVQSFSLIVTIIWAYFQQTIWALVGSNLIGSFLNMIGSHRLQPEKSNRFAWEKESLNELVSFGRWIFIGTAMNFLGGQADRLILGKLFPLSTLGVYTIALTLSQVPEKLLQQVSGKVIFPIMSQYSAYPRNEFRAKILKKRKYLLLFLGIILSILVIFGDLFVSILYDERFQEAGWMLSLLALGFWPGFLATTVNPALTAIGHPEYSAWGTFFRFLWIAIGMPLGFSQGGILTCVIIIALGDLPYYIAVSYGLVRQQLSCIHQDLVSSGIFAIIFIIFLAIRFMVGLGIPNFFQLFI